MERSDTLFIFIYKYVYVLEPTSFALRATSGRRWNPNHHAGQAYETRKVRRGEGRALSELVVASCCRGSDGVGVGRQGDRQVSGPLHFLMYALWMTSFSSLHPVDLSAFLGPKWKPLKIRQVKIHPPITKCHQTMATEPWLPFLKKTHLKINEK